MNMRSFPHFYLRVSGFFLLAGLVLTSQVFAQNLNVGFGKNRVQYHSQFDEWTYYETPHYITYWYGDARNVAISALQMAEVDYGGVQQILEHQMTYPIELLVFSDLSDLKQSNIGIDEILLLRAGETKVLGNKVFVYFDGDHRHLRRSIREGTAGVMIQSMLFGVNLQEIVQNAVLLNLPGWYTDGLAAHVGQPWSVELDHQLRTVLATGKYNTLDKLARHNPRLAGQAFWHYVGQQFGPGTVSNLLYLTRINRGLDAGFRYVLGNGYDRTSEAMMEYYQERYKTDERILEEVPKSGYFNVKNKRKLPLLQPKISPDGRQIAWVQNDIGKWRVYVQELGSKKKRRSVLRGGIRNGLQATDYAYPLLAWSPDNQTLAVMYEQRDAVKLAMIEVKTGKKRIEPVNPEFQRVYSIDFINPTDMVLTAEVRGVGDLLLYRTIHRQQERLTQDIWDDLDATYVRMGDHRYIMWASNRPVDTLSQVRLDSLLPVANFDLFLYDLDERSNELIRVTDTPIFDERQPAQADSAHFVFLTNASGVMNRGAARLEPYTAYYKRMIYLHNGSEVTTLDTAIGEWTRDKALAYSKLALLDSAMVNIDSMQVDSTRQVAVIKQRGVAWTSTRYNRHIAAFDASPSNDGTAVELILQEGNRHQLYVRRQVFENVEISAPQVATRYRASTLAAAGLPIPTGDSLSLPSVLVATPPQVTQIVIEPGWFFQVPEHLKQSAPQPLTPPTPQPGDDDTRIVAPPEVGVGQDADRWGDLLRRRPRMTLPGQFSPIKEPPVERINVNRIIPYRLRFRTDFVTTTADNNLLFEGLDSYAGTPGGFRTPPVGILLRANFKELLEDYVVEMGVRLPTSFSGAEYYMWLDDRKGRLDRRYSLYRKSIVTTLEETVPGSLGQSYQVRTNTLLGQYEVRYPFDPFFSLRAMATLRQDRTLTLTSDPASLETPNYAEQRAALRVGAVYDNTVDVDLNIKTGTRARLYVEAVKRFEFNIQPEWDFKFNSGFMTVINLDARHYQRLDRHSIVAARLAGGTTFGSERILYYLGGVDNWIIPRFNQSIPVAQGEAFAYQTLAAHMRGFPQNIRNGGSFALLNTELRVPIFKYFSRKPVPGNFWRNFQLVGFFDTGTAWTRGSPYDADNPINIVPLQNPPTVFVKVRYFRDPLVAGYGCGIRFPLFGMYLRADYAWGIETRVVQKPILHIALGTDF
jgi:hypothetical protein